MEFLQRFNTREQGALLALTVVVVLWLLYTLLWSPLSTRRDELVVQNTAVAEQLQRVDAMVAQYLQLQANGGQRQRSRNLTSLINQSTAQHGLEVSRLQPNARGDIQVRFEAMPFDNLLSWMHRLEAGEGLGIAEVSVTQAGQPGRVNATVRVSQGN